MTEKSASPVCYASEADDLYMGYAARDEILTALNELLEAERAGAKVALVSSKSETRSGYRELMRSIRADEAHWCAMLSRHIRRLAGSPTLKTGAFYGKAVVIVNPAERLLFLNRGQSWVVRKLEKLSPRIRDDLLHADLRAMADNHRKNIIAVDAFLEGAA